MSELHLLEPEPTPPHPEVITLLEDLLAQAKAGELRSLAYVASTDHGVATEWASGDAPDAWARLSAGASLLVHRLHAELLAQMEGD